MLYDASAYNDDLYDDRCYEDMVSQQLLEEAEEINKNNEMECYENGRHDRTERN